MIKHVHNERRRQAIYGWLMLSPAAIMLSIFAFYPSIATFWSSLFSRHTRRKPSEYIGPENYTDLFEVVLFVRPLCSPFKVDQGFILGC